MIQDDDFVSVGTVTSDIISSLDCSSVIESQDDTISTIGAEKKQLNTNCGSASPTPLAMDENGPFIDTSKWHTLSSLLPLLKLLPALKEHSGYYVLDGPLTDADVSLLCSRAKYVQVLSITGGQGSGSSSGIQPMVRASTHAKQISIAASVYIRILPHLRGEALLPSLERLSIDLSASENSDVRDIYPLLLVPSLRDLELEGIFSGADHVVLPFLSPLSYQTPQLQKLVLRGKSGYRFSSDYFDSIFKNMARLHYLELDDVVDSISVDLLATIGGFPELTTFILRGTMNELSNKLEGQNEYRGARGFNALCHLSMMASFELILYVLRHVESDFLESLAITPVVDTLYDELEAHAREVARMQAEASAKVEEARVKAEEARAVVEAAVKAEEALLNAESIIVGFGIPCSPIEIAPEIPCSPSDVNFILPTAPVFGNKKKGKKMSSYPIPSDSSIHENIAPSPPVMVPWGIPAHDNNAPLSPETASWVPPVPPPPVMISWATILEEILNLIPLSWPYLQSIKISLNDTSGKSRIFELPSRYLDSLRLLNHLVSLQLEHWKMDKDFNAILRSLAPSFQTMKKLSLPLGRFSSPVDLRTLQIISESCLALETLQVSVSIDDDVVQSLKGSAICRPNMHPLRNLSVGSDSTSGKMGGEVQIKKIVRLVDMIFPQLENITTHIGQEDDVWKRIWDLLTLCQDVRGDERIRCSTSAHLTADER